jgi:YVTN family beta-propeller protein
MKVNHLIPAILLLITLITACKKDPVAPPDLPSVFTNGVFIINEGPYNNGIGTISFLMRDGSSIVHQIYQQANSFIPLGNIVQSMTIINNVAYIAVNNSNKIELASAENMVSMGTIDNINYPAYIIQSGSDKAYVSSWDNVIYIISTNETEIIGQIPVGNGPTRMQLINDKVWVLNQGGFGVDSTISVIDPSTDQVIETIDLYPRPTGICQDKNGMVWILCSGKGYWQSGSTKGHLVSVDPDIFEVQNDLIFPDTINHPESLVIDNQMQTLFYNYSDGIYKFDITSTTLNESAFIQRQGKFYSLGYDKTDDVLYASDPVDYNQNGWVFRYRATTGVIIDSIKAGVVPVNYVFTD